MNRNIRYLVTGLVGMAITIAICLFKDIFKYTATIDRIAIISDATFTSGVCLASVGLLTWIANDGHFDTLTYGVKILGNMFRREEHRTQLEKNLYEYRIARHTQKKSVDSLIIMGAIYLIISAIFVYVFYQL